MNIVGALRGRGSLVVLATVAALGFGISSATQLPSGIYPETEFPRIVVVARVGDLPPEVVQTVATGPLEEALATVPHLYRLRARTIRGATELSAQFSSGTDMWHTLQLVQNAIAQRRSEGELADAELTIQRVMPSSLPIATFNVGGGVDPRILREAATRVVRPALTRIAGIGTVEVAGGDVRELEVVLHPTALAAAHLTPSALADRVTTETRVAAVGRATEDHQVLTVLAASEPTTAEQLAALPIGAGPNAPRLLSSVADVFEGSEDRAVTVTGVEGDVVVVTVSRSPGASAPDVVHQAHAILASLLASRALPPGVTIETVYDQSILIDDAMRGVRDAILIGIALSLIVLAIFLRDVRAGLAAAIAVPLTLGCTFGAMRLFGQTLNLMSLGGLAVAIGLIVDDAIVIVESIVRHLEDGEPVAAAAEHGTRDLFAAVVGTTLTTVVVFAPLALLSGVVGSFFGALAITLSSAVVLSLIIAVTVVPLVASRLLRPRPARGPSKLAAAYRARVVRLVRHPILSVIAVVALAVIGGFAARATSTGFLPRMDEGAMVVDFLLPQGTSLDETDRIARRLDRILVTTPGVVAFTRRTGTEMGPPTATQQNRGDVLVRLAPRRQRRSVYALMEEVRRRVAAEVPEMRVELVQVLQDMLDDLSGSPHPIEVHIFGPEPRVLEQLAGQAARRLEDLPALEDVASGVAGSIPTLRADIDPVATERLGVTPSQVADDLRVALAGRVAGQVRRGDQTYGIRVRSPDATRFDASALPDFPLAYADTTVPLSAVARVHRPVGPAVLTRENLRQVIIITAALADGADLGAATREVAQRLRELPLPAGYRLEVGGQLESARRTRRELARVFGLGIALVLAVLLIQLRSLRLALVVLLGAPLALVGAMITLVATGIPLDASSLMGCILLAGLVVKNGILLLEHAQQQQVDDFAEAVARAGARRLRPILMTTSATIAGLVPLALGIGAGSELQRPLAVATIGGLVLSTLVTLFAVPALACAVMRPRVQSSSMKNP